MAASNFSPVRISPFKASTSDYSIVSLNHPKKSKNDQNLIDLGQEEPRIMQTRVSVLEAFDPLLELEEDKPDNVEEIYNSSTLSESSFYEAYDPFEYMVSGLLSSIFVDFR